MQSKLCLRLIAILLSVVTFITMLTFASFSVSAGSNTVVTTDAVRFRSSPEINDDNYIDTLGVSEVLTLIADSTNGWANVRRSNGDKGYCSVDYLNVPSGSSVSFKGTTTEEVNFRFGPSTDYDALDYLDSGQEFTVLDNSDEYWVKVQIGSAKGYIYRSYTSLSLVLSDDTKPSEPEPTTPPESEPTYPLTEPTDPTDDFTPSADAPDTPNWYNSFLLSEDNIDRKIKLNDVFTLSNSEVAMNTGDSFKLYTLISGGSLEGLVEFASSDTNVATVTANGIVTGLSEGETVITASFGSRSDYCTVYVSGETYVPTVPTEPSTPEVTEPATTTVPETEPNTFELSASSATIEKGNLYVLTSPMKSTTWSSSNTAVATVENGLVTAISEGKAVITATSDGKTGVCSLTVTKASSGLTVEYSEVKVTKGKTFYNSADSSSSISWTSSDDSIATVSNGFITGVNKGTAVITATSSKGTKTCFVTVADAEPVRFTYAYPNTVAKNEEVCLVAITDKTRTAVQFKLSVNGDTVTVDADTKKTDGNTIIWTGKTKIAEAGTYKVTAYSKLGSKYSSCADSKTTVFVRENKDLLKETKEERRVSDELIALLASFEGYVGNVYFDNLAGGIPTLGYGKVVYAGDSFYNDMTKTEAYAQLYDTVNNGGYSSNVNSYLLSLDANYNQQQYDALVSFAYNIGYYGLKSDSEIRALILESKEKKTPDKVDKNAAYINGTQVNFRKGAGTSFESLGWLSYPDALTLVEDKLVNESWYHVKTADGTEGYVYKDFVTLGAPTTEGEIYLSLIDKSEFTRVVLEYHHAGSSCIYGLLYRRADELDLFYYGDYERDGNENRFGYTYSCYKDKNFTL